MMALDQHLNHQLFYSYILVIHINLCYSISIVNCVTDTDYFAGPYNVTIPGGTTRAVFNVSINDDDVVEGNENFILSIDQSSLPSNVTVGVRNRTTVTIFDNDCKFVVFV